MILSNKFSNLKYTIVVVLICGYCFDSKINYESKSNNVKIYNISRIHPPNHYTTILNALS